MRDGDVREALYRKVLNEHRDDPDTLVLDEVGICRGSARVDIAVVNGFLHGFEIKSERDTLQRLPAQVAIYSSTLDRVTLVCAASHVADAESIVPNWWGIKVATSGPRGAIHFREQRRPKLNPNIDAAALALVLWNAEAIALLEAKGLGRGAKGKSREALALRIAEQVPLNELRDYVRETLKKRKGWRSGVQQK